MRTRTPKDATRCTPSRPRVAGYPKPETATTVVKAGGVVVKGEGRDLRVLVIRSSDGARWVFPKGHVEPGESAEQTATREVREEAGVDTVVRRFAARERHEQGRRRVEVAYYLLEYRGDVAPSENREKRWCTPGEARRLLSFDELKLVLHEAVLA